MVNTHKKNNYAAIVGIFVVSVIILGIIGFFNRGWIRERVLDYKFKKIHDSLPPEKTAQEVAFKEEVKKDPEVVEISPVTSTPSKSSSTTTSSSKSSTSSTNTNTQSLKESSEINLKVPFTTQAPFKDWDMPYQEACEETAALMVHYFYEGKTFTPAIADKEIKDLVAYQEQTLGFYKDTTAEETAQFIRGWWGYDVEVRPATLSDLKKEVSLGHPVLVPTAGRELGNPFFKQPGPIYHMLVIRGYTKNGKIITNDPGIGRGENYVYDEQVLWKAMHDWNGGDVLNGEKLMIVIKPKNT